MPDFVEKFIMTARLDQPALDDDAIEEGHEENREEGRGEHAAHDAGAGGVPRSRARAGRDRERQHAEDERHRSHQDRPEAQPRRFDRGSGWAQALVGLQHRELDDQNRILGREAEQRYQAYLEVDVIGESAQPDRRQRAESPEGKRKQHRQRQGQLLILRGEDEEHHHHREAERERRRAARLLLLIRRAAPVVAEVGRQHFLRDLLDARDRLARADPGRALADDLYRRQVVEAIERGGARRIADRRQRRQRDHLALVRADVYGADVVGPAAVAGLRRHKHLPGTAVFVEIVHVVVAERPGERVVDIGDRHAERFRLLAIHFDRKLGHRRAPQRLGEGALWVLIGTGEKRMCDLGEFLRAAVAAILDVELEPTRGTEPEDGRRVEREHQRLFDAGGFHEHLADQLRRGGLALIPVLLGDEDRSRVVAKSSAQEVESGKRDHVLVGWIGVDRLLDFGHYLFGALLYREIASD